MPEAKKAILSEREILRIERANPEGLTSAQIVQIFQKSGARLSEATFRKYVQLGLVPRCRRVGSKGKHKGSRGIYPCAAVRRINTIKRLMRSSYTIEEIQRSFSNFKAQIDQVESAIEDLFKGFEREVSNPRFDHSRGRGLGQEIDQARRTAGDLIRQVQQIESQLVWPEKELSVAGAGGLTSHRSMKSR